MKSIEHYLINVGIRSFDFSYSEKSIFENIDYFKKCFKKGLSPYKALLYLGDYMEGDYLI